MRKVSFCLLGLIVMAALAAPWISTFSYDTQTRELPNAAPSREHPLGTDDLGRDRFARLLYGTQVSLALAPAAALLATLLGGLVGLAAALSGGRFRAAMRFTMTVFLAFPWLFLLLMVRAALPLNVPAWTSVSITFLLLGLLGWASGACVVESGAGAILDSGYLLAARAQGLSPLRLYGRHVLPALGPLLAAQFWVALPGFILSEAALGLLGLGVAEPLPSLGGLTAELQNLPAVAESPWMVAPAALLALILLCLRAAASGVSGTDRGGVSSSI
jgi:ABC-type dipeptide/oligopeptide/nickel transport system permease subunit